MVDTATQISVVIPIYNAATTLRPCLESLRHQVADLEGIQVICVDNGSSDESQEIVKSFPEFTLLIERKPGAYAARNRGAAAAEGDIVAFTDPDCVADQGWLRSVSAAFQDLSCLAALGVRRPAPDTGLNQLLGDYEVAKDRWVLSSSEPRKYYGYTNNMAVRQHAWKTAGPFDENRLRGGDTIFIRRLVDAVGCDAVQFVPSMRIAHLEVDSFAIQFQKTFTYGKSLQSYSQAVPSSPLSFSDRMKVFRSTVDDNCYGRLRAVALMALLLSGLAAWWTGRITAWLRGVFAH